MPWFGRDYASGSCTGGPYVDPYRWMAWSEPARGRKTLMYRRTLHRAVAIDPDTLEWYAADLQPWTCEKHRGLELALREPLPGLLADHARTHELMVDVIRQRTTLDEAAQRLCEVFRELEDSGKLPDLDARPWIRLPRSHRL